MYSTLHKNNILLHSTLGYSTVQHSTLQESTVHYSATENSKEEILLTPILYPFVAPSSVISAIFASRS